MAFQEIGRMCGVGSGPNPNSSALRFLGEAGESFAGNFSTVKRKSFFDHRRNEAAEIPCGFLKEFPVRDSGLFLSWLCGINFDCNDQLGCFFF